jgi:hypothetical protein
MALNQSNGIEGQVEVNNVTSSSPPSIIARAKQAALALLLSTWLAGSPAIAEEKGVQVADASGNVVSANYEKGKLSPADIQSGINELTAWYIADGETEADAKWYAQDTLDKFLSWVSESSAEDIAKFAPKLTKEILKNPEQYQLSLVLDIENNNLIALKNNQDANRIAKARKELQGAREAIN